MKRNLLLLFALIMIGFSSNAQVSLIGAGATGCWDPGCDMDLVDQGGGIWTLNAYTMPGGDFKFRLNHEWDAPAGGAWGNSTFPSGTGDTTPGAPNIVAIAGTYDITFDQNTGAYSFSGGAPISIVKIIGSATTAEVNMITTDAENYTVSNVTLVDGTAQFDIDGAAFGSTTFPDGTATSFTDLIPVTAGTYSSITFNIGSGEYHFIAAPVYPVISLIGSGTTGTNAGWNNDFVDLTTNDGITYTAKNITLYSVNSESADPGAVKFRINHDWPGSFGGLTFPSGPQVGNENDNILVNDGTYNVTFNLPTGAYTFSYPSIAIVGDGTIEGWPPDPLPIGYADPNVLSTTDGNNYTIDSITLLDGNVKFREGTSWTTNWGSASFPVGVGTQDGSNIPTTAGTYSISFNRVTGDFNFATLGTKSFGTSTFKVYPNPTTNNWNFTSVKGATIQSVQIVDMLGKTIMNVAPANTDVTIDASALNAGIYFAKIATATATETVKVVRN